MTLRLPTGTMYTIVEAGAGRRLLGNKAKHCSNKLFPTMEKMHECMYGTSARRLDANGALTPSAAIGNTDAYAETETRFDETCNSCEHHFMPYDPYQALPVSKAQCKCFCSDAGTGSVSGNSTESSTGQECCTCPGDTAPATEEVSFYRNDVLSPAANGAEYYNSGGYQSYCYNLLYFTGPDMTCAHPESYAGQACANFGTPEEMYCNPSIAAGACARCIEDPSYTPSPIARRQRRALTTRQRRQRARGRAAFRRLHEDASDGHIHSGSCANSCGGPGTLGDCDCGPTCAAFSDCCVDFDSICSSEVSSVDFGINGDVYLYNNGTIENDNLIGTGATLDTTSGAYVPPVDPSWAFNSTAVNSSGDTEPSYEWQVYDDSVNYHEMCSSCAYAPLAIDDVLDELYAFDVRFGGGDDFADGGEYPTEIEWSIVEGDTDTEQRFALVAPPYNWPYVLEQDTKLELKVGTHTLQMFDTYGDGWNGAQWELYHWDSSLPVLGGDGMPITCRFGYAGAVDWAVAHHSTDDPLRNDPDQPAHTHRTLTEERKSVSDANRRQLHWGQDCDTIKDGACRKCEFVIPTELEVQAMASEPFAYVKAHESGDDDAPQPFTGESFTWAPSSSPTTNPTNAPTCEWECI